jgi:hemerythrin
MLIDKETKSAININNQQTSTSKTKTKTKTKTILRELGYSSAVVRRRH